MSSANQGRPVGACLGELKANLRDDKHRSKKLCDSLGKLAHSDHPGAEFKQLYQEVLPRHGALPGAEEVRTRLYSELRSDFSGSDITERLIGEHYAWTSSLHQVVRNIVQSKVDGLVIAAEDGRMWRDELSRRAYTVPATSSQPSLSHGLAIANEATALISSVYEPMKAVMYSAVKDRPRNRTLAMQIVRSTHSTLTMLYDMTSVFDNVCRDSTLRTANDLVAAKMREVSLLTQTVHELSTRMPDWRGHVSRRHPWIQDQIDRETAGPQASSAAQQSSEGGPSQRADLADAFSNFGIGP